MSELPGGTVTFLFTDIEGSTRLLGQYGEDRYAEVLADHHRLLREVFERQGGREVDTQGDAFFVAFERAKDAVAAAVDGQRALSTHRWPSGADVHVRMGLHTGEPAVGADRYVGLGVHRAARISSVGHGGQILLSSATRELIADDLPAGVALVDLGEYQLKDLERPDRVYQLVVEGLPHQFPPLKAQKPAAASAFVGRDGELAELMSSLEDSLAGRGRVVLLAGDPGIGKSRLADEFASRARERGARVLWGRCWEAGGAPAYWPWVQSLRSYLRDVGSETLRAEMGPGASDIAQMLPELRDLFLDLPDPPSADPEGARFRLFDSTASFLRTAASRRPLVLILDDLYAADTPSLLLLEFLGGELADAHVLIVGTYRDIEIGRDHPLRRTLAELARTPTTRTSALGGLSEAEVAELIEAITGQAPPDGVAAAIHGETEGNPLFVGEVVRLLAAEGTLAEVREERGRRLVLPESVREVIGRRLRRLSDECIRVLTLASVLGRDFALDALELLSERSADELLDVLDEGAAARVVADVPGSPGRFRFSHALVRDTLYDELTPARRLRLHRRTGEVLEELYAENLDPHLAELAHHFFESAAAGEADKALDYGRRAAERAVALLAYEEAARLYQMALRALELIPSAGELVRCELLLCLGDAQTRAGDLAEAKATFLAAAPIARKLEAPEQLAHAALGYGGRFVWGRAGSDRRLVPLLEEAAAALGDEESVLRAKVLARLAGALRDSPDRERSASLSEQAVEIARRAADPVTLAYVLDGRYSAIWWPENPEERLEIATEIVRLSEEVGDKERAVQGHHYRVMALMELGDIPAADAELEAKAKLAEELRQPAQLWYLAVTRAMRALFDGRFGEAEELMQQALAFGRRAQSWDALLSFRLQEFTLRKEQGRLEEVEDSIRRSVEEYPSYPMLRCVLADLYSELGREPESRSLFESLAANDFGDLPLDTEWLFGMSFLPDVCAFFADARRAGVLYDVLLPYARRNTLSPPEVSNGAVARGLGVLAATMSRWDEACRHFEDALRMNAKMGARPWVARTQHDYARMLLTRDEPGDREKALELLSACLEIAHEVGSEGLAARGSALGGV